MHFLVIWVIGLQLQLPSLLTDSAFIQIYAELVVQFLFIFTNFCLLCG